MYTSAFIEQLWKGQPSVESNGFCFEAWDALLYRARMGDELEDVRRKLLYGSCVLISEALTLISSTQTCTSQNTLARLGYWCPGVPIEDIYRKRRHRVDR